MAAPLPSAFFDPFHPGNLASDPISSVPENGQLGIPTSNGPATTPLVPERTNTLPIVGQGTIAMSSNATETLSLSAKTDLADGPILHLIIGVQKFEFYSESALGREEIPCSYTKGRKEEEGKKDGAGVKACFLNPGIQTTYWLSLDAHHGRLRYGKYFTNKAMTLLEANLGYGKPNEDKDKDDDKGKAESDNVEKPPSKFDWLKHVKTVQAWEDSKEAGSLTPVIHPMPVVIDLPPFVLPADQVTLQDLDLGKYTSPSNLPEACQILYGNVAGTKIVLNDDDFPDFAEAIQYSCTTEGCWAYKRLKKKASKFGHGDKGSYLRITLGYNLGDSPGVPYVLEIWPGGHFSPIHDHGNACAVIKVLHGSINCTWYKKLEKESVQIGSANLRKGNVTWIGDNNYQIHKLLNPTPTVCVTIQCYRYSKQDNVHDDGFDYVNAEGLVETFTPDSDKTFIDFRTIIRKEWEEACNKVLAQN